MCHATQLLAPPQARRHQVRSSSRAPSFAAHGRVDRRSLPVGSFGPTRYELLPVMCRILSNWLFRNKCRFL